MFFHFKKDETGAINQFKKNCTYHGLQVKLSLTALNALKQVIEAGLKDEVAEIGERELHTLGRRGMIRVVNEGEPIATELGLMTAAMAEAGGLISFKGVVKEMPNVKAK